MSLIPSEHVLCFGEIPQPSSSDLNREFNEGASNLLDNCHGEKCAEFRSYIFSVSYNLVSRSLSGAVCKDLCRYGGGDELHSVALSTPEFEIVHLLETGQDNDAEVIEGGGIYLLVLL